MPMISTRKLWVDFCSGYEIVSADSSDNGSLSRTFSAGCPLSDWDFDFAAFAFDNKPGTSSTDFVIDGFIGAVVVVVVVGFFVVVVVEVVVEVFVVVDDDVPFVAVGAVDFVVLDDGGFIFNWLVLIFCVFCMDCAGAAAGTDPLFETT